MKTLLRILAAAVLAGTAFIAPSLTPCATEDQETACYWGGGSNGQGASYIVTFTGNIIYL